MSLPEKDRITQGIERTPERDRITQGIERTRRNKNKKQYNYEATLRECWKWFSRPIVNEKRQFKILDIGVMKMKKITDAKGNLVAIRYDDKLSGVQISVIEIDDKQKWVISFEQNSKIAEKLFGGLEDG